MNTFKNNEKKLWAWSALCLVAPGLTTGTGCDPQATNYQAALDAATGPSAAMARLFSPVIETRLEPVKLVETTRLAKVIRLESADSVGIALLR